MNIMEKYAYVWCGKGLTIFFYPMGFTHLKECPILPPGVGTIFQGMIIIINVLLSKYCVPGTLSRPFHILMHLILIRKSVR